MLRPLYYFHDSLRKLYDHLNKDFKDDICSILCLINSITTNTKTKQKDDKNVYIYTIEKKKLRTMIQVPPVIPYVVVLALYKNEPNMN